MFVPGATRTCAAGDSRQALQRAADLAQQGKLEEADRQAHLALPDPSTRAVAYSILGAIRLQQKRVAESIKFLQNAIQLEPQLIGARETLAEAYTVQGNAEAALNLYRETIALLRPTMQSDHLEVAEQAIRVIDEASALLSSMF